MFECRHTWIDLNGVLAGRREGESLRDRIEQFRDLMGAKIRRSSPTPMHLRDDTTMRDFGQVHLLDEIVHIRVRDRMVLLDNNVASAIQTQPLAKRNVHIN